MQRANRVLAGLAVCLVAAGCNDTSKLAPTAPDTPWPVPASAAPTKAEVPPVSAVAPAEINPGHLYTLAELIDIAERRNKATHIAWEQARQAAINVGIAQAALLPVLTASAIGGISASHRLFPAIWFRAASSPRTLRSFFQHWPSVISYSTSAGAGKRP